MSATDQAPLILTSKPVVERLNVDLKTRVAAFIASQGRAPKLAVVLVGEDAGSVIYTTRKGEAATQAGFLHETVKFPVSAKALEVQGAIERLNQDPSVDGILVQRPLPGSYPEEETLYWISEEKDVDAFHPANLGRLTLGLPSFQPCTPAGVMQILKHYQIPIAGKIACVIGRSAIVGKPMAALLLQADATVIHCHSKTPGLAALAKQADILVAAVGRAEMIDDSFIKSGATVIDVGINRRADGKVVGDVAFESAKLRAGAITPVPGGVGPMTILVLLQNTIFAAENREKNLALRKDPSK